MVMATGTRRDAGQPRGGDNGIRVAKVRSDALYRARRRQFATSTSIEFDGASIGLDTSLPGSSETVDVTSGAGGDSANFQAAYISATPGCCPIIVVWALATVVVVTVHGGLGCAGSDHLEVVLADLIDDQANLTVAVDLAKATVEPGIHMVFVVAACRARRRGTRFIVMNASAVTNQALQSGVWGDLVEILPETLS